MKQHYSRILTSTAFCGIAALLLPFGSGCTISMKHGQLASPAKMCSETVRVSRAAIGSQDRPKGAKGRAGWGRFTIFAIPVVPVFVTGDGNADVMNGIQDALSQTGYKVEVADPPQSGSDKILVCKVTKMRYNNYTWLFPIVPTWGETCLDVSLMDGEQKTLWNRQFSSRATSFWWFINAYTHAAKKNNTRILNDMISACSSEEFRVALAK